MTLLAYLLPPEGAHFAPYLAIPLASVAAGVGDYVLQTQRMQLKVTSWGWALLHATVYTTPFLILTLDPLALFLIGGTHAIIDRLRLGAAWCRWWGVGQAGAFDRALASRLGDGWVPLPGVAPGWMRIWLSIRADNAMHRVIEVGALILACWRLTP